MAPDVMLSLRLSKEGFGNFQTIRSMPTPDVLAMLTYSNFLHDYQETAAELNRPEGSR